VQSRDSIGGSITSYTEAGSARAMREPKSGGRQYAAEGKQYETNRTYRVRYNADLVPGWRIIDGSAAYEVVAVSYQGRNHMLDLECRTIETTGDNNVVNFTAYHESANSTGNTTVTLASLCLNHTEVTAVTGTAGTRIMVIAIPTDLVTGARLTHRMTMPATASILIEWRNATAGGTLLTSFLSDTSGDDVVGEFVYNGTAWAFLRFAAPANA
jgi:SPP1 family predicted phage head-tail adaptor